MSLILALFDAAKNCDREGAGAIITLKSGRQLAGRLKHESGGFTAGGTGQLHTPSPSDGWITFAVDEVAAVESTRRL
jgi:hypothetical protein